MSKSGYVLALVLLTAGVTFAGCIVEYDGNEAAAGAATGGSSTTGGSTTSKGGGTSTGGSTTTSGSSEGCSVGHRAPRPSAPAMLAVALGLALSFRRRRRARG